MAVVAGGQAAPNRACSGHGYAVGQRWRFEGRVASPTMLLGKHAVPLTLVLGFYLLRCSVMGKKQGKSSIYIVLFVVLLLSTLTSCSGFRPVNPNKDWLDILSQLGESAGIVALIGLVYEVYYRRKKDLENATPKLIFRIVGIEEELPAKAACWLCEQEEPEGVEVSRYEGYWRMWRSFDSERKRYVKIVVENKGIHIRSEASDLSLSVRFFYFYTQNEDDIQVKEFECPELPEITVPPGEKRALFIRCGNLVRRNPEKIEVEIVRYKCKNRDGRLFKGKELAKEILLYG